MKKLTAKITVDQIAAWVEAPESVSCRIIETDDADSGYQVNVNYAQITSVVWGTSWYEPIGDTILVCFASTDYTLGA